LSEAPKFSRTQRWRLVLGKRAEDRMGAEGLSREMAEIDAALGAIYDPEEAPAEGQRRSAGLGASAPRLATWLGDVRRYFQRDVVVVIQQDAIERKGLKQLLFEPELLAQVTPSVELVGTLLSLKGMIPDRTRDTARQVVAAVVEEIRKKLQGAVEQAVRGALDRSRHQPVPSLPNLDWKRTIEGNLKNYLPERRTLLPDRFHFFARQRRRREWNVIVCMDQSGSMADSVVYASVMGAIFASIPALETHVIAFDTEVVDLTEQCSDPVDLLFGVQLGGGTDIHRAISYCQGLIHDPQKTLLLLITDLFEGGNESQLVRRMEALAHSGVRALCLLALNDSGVPSYDERLARKFASVGVPCMGCTPGVLPEVLAGLLKGHDLADLVARHDSRRAGALLAVQVAQLGPQPRLERLEVVALGAIPLGQRRHLEGRRGDPAPHSIRELQRVPQGPQAHLLLGGHHPVQADQPHRQRVRQHPVRPRHPRHRQRAQLDPRPRGALDLLQLPPGEPRLPRRPEQRRALVLVQVSIGPAQRRQRQKDFLGESHARYRTRALALHGTIPSEIPRQDLP
jgi:Mg-chelatase subunit ChlD